MLWLPDQLHSITRRFFPFLYEFLLTPSLTGGLVMPIRRTSKNSSFYTKRAVLFYERESH